MKTKAPIPLVPCLLSIASVAAPFARASAEESPPAPAVAPAAAPGPAPLPAPAVPAISAPPRTAPPAPDGVRFAIELGTGGLSGAQGGAFGLGWGTARVAGGISVDFQHSSLKGPDEGVSTAELTENQLAVGPWLRWDMVRALDGRVALFGAADVQFAWQQIATKVDTSADRTEASASGAIIRLGPGIRFWATPWLAVGYSTQVSITTLSGPLLAFTQSTALGPSDYAFDQFKIGLDGRFSVLALF